MQFQTIVRWHDHFPSWGLRRCRKPRRWLHAAHQRQDLPRYHAAATSGAAAVVAAPANRRLRGGRRSANRRCNGIGDLWKKRRKKIPRKWWWKPMRSSTRSLWADRRRLRRCPSAAAAVDVADDAANGRLAFLRRRTRFEGRYATTLSLTA